MSSLFFFNLKNANGIPSFANHIFCFFVTPQSEEYRLPKLAVVRPLGKLDWATSTGSTQWQRFMTAGVIARPSICLRFSPIS